VGELQADVCIQFAGGDFLEQVVIKLGAGSRFGGVGDVFTEIVDGNAGAGLIDCARGPERVFDVMETLAPI
jgi:hypothetical protein